jgi:hypothetical protein
MLIDPDCELQLPAAPPLVDAPPVTTSSSEDACSSVLSSSSSSRLSRSVTLSVLLRAPPSHRPSAPPACRGGVCGGGAPQRAAASPPGGCRHCGTSASGSGSRSASGMWWRQTGHRLCGGADGKKVLSLHDHFACVGMAGGWQSLYATLSGVGGGAGGTPAS